MARSLNDAWTPTLDCQGLGCGIVLRYLSVEEYSALRARGHVSYCGPCARQMIETQAIGRAISDAIFHRRR